MRKRESMELQALRKFSFFTAETVLHRRLSIPFGAVADETLPFHRQLKEIARVKACPASALWAGAHAMSTHFLLADEKSASD